MADTSLKQRLNSGKEAVLGCFIRYPGASLVEFLALQRWDVVVLDAEHGPLEPHTCEDMVRAAELHGVAALVRVPSIDGPVVLRYMDTGAVGVHAPWIESAEHAQQAVAAVKFAPEGRRGLAASRAAAFAQKEPLARWITTANQQSVVVAQIESPAAVDNLPQILATPGIDVIFIGPTDLSNSAGYPGDIEAPAVRDLIDRTARLVGDSDKALGIMVTSVEAAQRWIDRGARYITVTFEAMAGAACRQYLHKLRAS